MKKVVSLAVVAGMSMVLVAGCSSKDNGVSEPTSTSVEADTTVSTEVESTTAEVDTEFNEDDTYIQRIKGYLEGSKYYAYTGVLSENGVDLLVTDEKYDFENKLAYTKSDYSGYKNQLIATGMNVGIDMESVFETYIDCNNNAYVELLNGEWVLDEANQSAVDFSQIDGYTSAWDAWKTTMAVSGIYFNDGNWTESGDKVTYDVTFDNLDANGEGTKETITMSFDKDGNYLKPEGFSSDAQTITASKGYTVNADGSVSNELTTTLTATKTSTYISYNFTNQNLTMPEYTVIEEESATVDEEFTIDAETESTTVDTESTTSDTEVTTTEETSSIAE